MPNPTSKLNLVINGATTQLDIHDANAVDLTNNQTVGGIKTFSNAPVVGSILLDGKTIDTDANGNMTFDSHIVDTIEEQGEGYIRYTNGIQICWIQGKQSDSVYTWNFPKTFVMTPVVTATTYYKGGNFNVYQRSVELNDPTNTHVVIRAASHSFGSNTYTVGNDYINAIAIGRWK